MGNFLCRYLNKSNINANENTFRRRVNHQEVNRAPRLASTIPCVRCLAGCITPAHKPTFLLISKE